VVFFAPRSQTEFRQKFQKPVGDPPTCSAIAARPTKATSLVHAALDVQEIRSMPTTLEIYGKKLTAEGVVSGARSTG